MAPAGEPVLADVTACVACGYLINVPDPAGRCPECGTPFDRRALVLFGRRRFQRWDAPFGVAFALLYAGLFTRMGRDRLSWMYGAVYGLSAVGYAATWARRSWATRPAPARLRMDRTGCGLDVEPPAVPVVAHVVTAARSAWQRHAAPTDAAAVAEPWVVGEWVPWSRVRSVELRAASGGRWRVRVRRAGTAPGRRVPIDLIADPTPEQLTAVRQFASRFATVTT